MKNTLRQQIISQNLGQNVRDVEKIAHQLIEKGTDIIYTQRNIRTMVEDIINHADELRHESPMHVWKLSPTLACHFIALRTVYMREMRRHIIHELIPEILGAVNELLESHDMRVKINKKQRRPRYSTTTMVSLKSIKSKRKG